MLRNLFYQEHTGVLIKNASFFFNSQISDFKNRNNNATVLRAFHMKAQALNPNKSHKRKYIPNRVYENLLRIYLLKGKTQLVEFMPPVQLSLLG